MGSGIDRTGPNNESYITSAVTIVDHYDYEDDPCGDLWMEEIDSCIFEMGGQWKKPTKKEWISSGYRREYYVLARHEGNLDAAIVASTDADCHAELFVTVARDRCDNPGMEALVDGMVHRWCLKLREALKPMQPRAATSAWTSSRIFHEVNKAA